tara:strand:- start:720 stop:1367 length:648 start_codon:yes stop_codon:yes gene_type:complete
MENYFKKLSAINTKKMQEKKGNYTYLSWAIAWALLKEQYPNAQRIVYESQQTELPYFTDGTTASVKVGIVANGIEHIDYLPVKDYSNKSVPLAKITSMLVNTTIQRATAKAIAMHGLGLSMWINEDIDYLFNETKTSNKKEVINPQADKFVLDLRKDSSEDNNYEGIMNFIAKNSEMGIEELVLTFSNKYNGTAYDKNGKKVPLKIIVTNYKKNG